MNSKIQKESIAAVSRSRAPNFTREEQEIFIKVIEPYVPIIESKKTDYIKQSDKQRAWAKISEIYNANTTQCPRTVDNLISCYRNMKSRVKKQHSQAKMLLKDPSQKEALITAIEENGKDWPSISNVTNLEVEVCQMGYEGLKEEVKKAEINYKKKVMGTGGGPPPSDDNPINRIKKIIEPQIEGLFTMYDGDYEIMRQYQDSIPEIDRIQPIENVFIQKNELLLEPVAEEDASTPNRHEMEVTIKDADHCNPWETPKETGKSISRTDILNRRSDSALNIGKSARLPKGKKNTHDCFTQLAEEKIKLVKLNQEVAAEELKERKMNVVLKEMDIAQKKKLQELELENFQKENLYKEEMRRQELLLMDLKIKKLCK